MSLFAVKFLVHTEIHILPYHVECLPALTVVLMDTRVYHTQRMHILRAVQRGTAKEDFLIETYNVINKKEANGAKLPSEGL